MLARERECATQLTWTRCQIDVSFRFWSMSTHDFEAVYGFKRSNQNCFWRALFLRHNIEAIIHAVDQINVSVPAAHIHGASAIGAAPTERMTSAIGHAEVGFCFNDAA